MLLSESFLEILKHLYVNLNFCCHDDDSLCPVFTFVLNALREFTSHKFFSIISLPFVFLHKYLSRL